MTAGRHRLLIALGVGLLALAGCGRHRDAVEPNAGPPPAIIDPVPGTGVNRITLTQSAVDHLGIQTTAVVADPSRPIELDIPLSAVIYDPTGASWAYVNVAPRAYQRAPIVIDQIVGDTAALTSGPPVGTVVVTVGGQELLGAEYGVGEE
jgi:hypothetical protein